MKSIRSASLMRQMKTLTVRNYELIYNDKSSLITLVLQAPAMLLIIALIGSKDCYSIGKTDAQTVTFVLASIAAVMGLLNSFREVCKERDVIRREYSVGLNLPAYIFSKMLVLITICIYQSLVLVLGSLIIIHFPKEGVLMSAVAEYYITILLTLISSVSFGILVSTILKNTESAILPVLFIIIAQLVFSGTLFDLKGVTNVISFAVVDRYAMSALGATFNLNSFFIDPHMYKNLYDSTAGNLLYSWLAFVLISFACVALSVILLQLKLRKFKE